MIRKLNTNDIDAVADIWLKTNIEAHFFINESYWQGNYEAVKEMLGNAEIYVYEDKGRLKGFVGLDNEYIAGIFVLKEAQSKGIGKQLLDYVKNIKGSLFLNVYQKNQRAVKFYKREGFTIQEEKTDELTNEKEFLMIWKR